MVTSERRQRDKLQNYNSRVRYRARQYRLLGKGTLRGSPVTTPARRGARTPDRKIVDPRAFHGPGDGASLPITLAREAAPVTLNIAPGAIVVQQQPGEDGAALANRVLEKLRDRARAQTGDTLDFGRLV